MTRDDGPDDELMTRFSAVLHDEAAAYQPSANSLTRIQGRAPKPASRTPWRWAAPLAAAAVVVGVASAMVLLPNGDQSATPLPGASSTPSSPPPTDLPSPGPYSCTRPDLGDPVPSYYVGTFEGRSALYRAFLPATCWRATSDDAGAPVVEQAVRNMSEPAAHDLDYQSLWPAGLTVTGFSRYDGQVAGVVSLSLDADPVGDMTLALQQLVYTVTAADPTIRGVLVGLPGDPPAADKGVVYRAAAIDVLAPVWLIDVSSRSTADGVLVTMAGTASVFEATVNWQITDEHGTVVDSGNAMTPEAAPARGPWTATSKPLPRGYHYTVTAFEASPMDGRMTWPDTKAVP